MMIIIKTYREFIKHCNGEKAILKANFVLTQHNFDRELQLHRAKKRYALKDVQSLSTARIENSPCF